MDDRETETVHWLALGAIMAFTRGLSAWGSLVTGDPPSTWLPEIVLAVLWGGYPIGLYFTTTHGTTGEDGNGFSQFRWPVGGVLVLVAITSLTLLAMDYEFLRVGLDAIVALLLLVFGLGLHLWTK